MTDRELEYLHERVNAVAFVTAEIAKVICAHVPSAYSEINTIFTHVNDKLVEINAEFEASKEVKK